MLWRISISFAAVLSIVLEDGSASALGWMRWSAEWMQYTLLVLTALLATGAIWYREGEMAFTHPPETKCANCDPRCPSPTFWDHINVEWNVCSADRRVCDCRRFVPKA